MPQFISLTASDGQKLSAWLSEPDQKPVGAVVVIQEIFGVNSHIQDVTDRFAALGYLAIAPALFDRIEPGFECGYDEADRARAFAIYKQINLEEAVLDVAAAIDRVRIAGKVGVVGYCFGGLMSWLAACRLRPDAAVGYYGRVEQAKDEQPHCPVQLHFGLRDSGIPQSSVQAVQAAHPDVPVYLYDAEHGFACDQRGSFNPAATALAWERTKTFLAENLR